MRLNAVGIEEYGTPAVQQDDLWFHPFGLLPSANEDGKCGFFVIVLVAGFPFVEPVAFFFLPLLDELRIARRELVVDHVFFVMGFQNDGGRHAKWAVLEIDRLTILVEANHGGRPFLCIRMK